jgi:hypothetical protein
MVLDLLDKKSLTPNPFPKGRGAEVNISKHEVNNFMKNITRNFKLSYYLPLGVS